VTQHPILTENHPQTTNVISVSRLHSSSQIHLSKAEWIAGGYILMYREINRLHLSPPVTSLGIRISTENSSICKENQRHKTWHTSRYWHALCPASLEKSFWVV